MATKTPKGSRTTVRGRGWKRATTIDTDKYHVISRAIMSSLTAAPITFSELVDRVSARLVSFEGSVPWYTISGLRELEVQGKVERHPKPVRYSRKRATKVRR